MARWNEDSHNGVTLVGPGPWNTSPQHQHNQLLHHNIETTAGAWRDTSPKGSSRSKTKAPGGEGAVQVEALSTSWSGLKSDNPEQQVSGPTLQISTFISPADSQIYPWTPAELRNTGSKL